MTLRERRPSIKFIDILYHGLSGIGKGCNSLSCETFSALTL
jgi:hypothetical protein